MAGFKIIIQWFSNHACAHLFPIFLASCLQIRNSSKYNMLWEILHIFLWLNAMPWKCKKWKHYKLCISSATHESLKALCHYIRADCLLMKLHVPTRWMNMGRGRWLVSLRVDSNLPAEACSVGRLTFQAAYLLLNLYLSASLLFGCPYHWRYELLHSTSTKSLRCMHSISANSRTQYGNTGHAHTSCTHFNWIFELMSSLRSNYALYRDTMP